MRAARGKGANLPWGRYTLCSLQTTMHLNIQKESMRSHEAPHTFRSSTYCPYPTQGMSTAKRARHCKQPRCCMQMAMHRTIWGRWMWTQQAPHIARSFTGCPCPTRGMSCITAAGMPARHATAMAANPAASSCCPRLALAESTVLHYNHLLLSDCVPRLMACRLHIPRC